MAITRATSIQIEEPAITTTPRPRTREEIIERNCTKRCNGYVWTKTPINLSPANAELCIKFLTELIAGDDSQPDLKKRREYDRLAMELALKNCSKYHGVVPTDKSQSVKTPSTVYAQAGIATPPISQEETDCIARCDGSLYTTIQITLTMTETDTCLKLLRTASPKYSLNNHRQKMFTKAMVNCAIHRSSLQGLIEPKTFVSKDDAVTEAMYQKSWNHHSAKFNRVEHWMDNPLGRRVLPEVTKTYLRPIETLRDGKIHTVDEEFPKKRDPGTPMVFENSKGTCWLNAGMQIWMAAPNFKQAIGSVENKALRQSLEVIEKSNTERAVEIDLSKLRGTLTERFKTCQGYDPTQLVKFLHYTLPKLLATTQYFELDGEWTGKWYRRNIMKRIGVTVPHPHQPYVITGRKFELSSLIQVTWDAKRVPLTEAPLQVVVSLRNLIVTDNTLERDPADDDLEIPMKLLLVVAGEYKVYELVVTVEEEPGHAVNRIRDTINTGTWYYVSNNTIVVMDPPELVINEATDLAAYNLVTEII